MSEVEPSNSNVDDVDNGESTAPGQELSKNAMKKAAKAAEAAQKKAAKEAEKAAKKSEEPASLVPKLGGDDGEDLDPTQYYENRLKAITAIEVSLFITLQYL